MMGDALIGVLLYFGAGNTAPGTEGDGNGDTVCVNDRTEHG